MDVDFVPSAGLSAKLQGAHAELLHAARVHRVALVVPAFEMAPGVSAARRRCELEGRSSPFHVEHFAKGHRPTAYGHWWGAREAYEVEYALCYEPYVVVARESCPPYDERFRGYGMNKIVHILALHSHGGRFWVLPEEFVSAERHEKSSAWQTTYESSRGDLQRRRIASLFRQARRELEEARGRRWRGGPEWGA